MANTLFVDLSVGKRYFLRNKIKNKQSFLLKESFTKGGDKMNIFIILSLMGLTLTALGIVSYLYTGCKCAIGVIFVSAALTASWIMAYVLERRKRRGSA